jgi:hypothetical protein
MYELPERYNIFSIRGETLSFVIHWRRENSGRVPRYLGKASFLGRALIGRRAPVIRRCMLGQQELSPWPEENTQPGLLDPPSELTHLPNRSGAHGRNCKTDRRCISAKPKDLFSELASQRLSGVVAIARRIARRVRSKALARCQRKLPGLASSSRIRKRDRTIIAQTRGSQHLRNLLPNRTSSFGILAIKDSKMRPYRFAARSSEVSS